MTAKQISDKVLEKYPMVFRNDCGMAYVGGRLYNFKKTVLFHVKRGDRIVVNPSQIKYGLHPGSSDMIGWHTITITPEMVGKKVAVFTSVEIKTKDDRLNQRQKDWNRVVDRDGGTIEVWQETEKGIVCKKGYETT